MTGTLALDPLRAAPGGRYADERVVVVAAGGPAGVRAGALGDGRVLVRHHLGRLDDDLAEDLAAALAPLGDDHDLFARAFTGVVVTSHADPVTAWARFYRASLARIREPHRGGYAAVHRHALDLLPRTSVVDLGASLGFLALHLAQLGVAVTAVEHDAGTARLLRLMADALGADLGDVAADTAALPDDAADAVALLHVLEHVDTATGAALLAEAVRVARRRVVVAVPYEDRPVGLYGHVRSVTPDDLAALGAASGSTFDVHEHHGGWLVLDLPAGGGSGTR